MDLQYYLDFIKQRNEFYQKRFGEKIPGGDFAIARVVKLTEECGELAAEVLTSRGLARKEKLERFKKEDLDFEVADVFYTLLSLAVELEVDLEEALLKKQKIIQERS